ncbi:hypothetical protein FRC17_008090 [Serendipita sp. 399]|nr:hypothetical protein FRC17_008090 [Serendipita sp. 399]
MALYATPLNGPLYHTARFSSYGRPQLHQRIAYDESLLQTITELVSSAETTTINAAKAVQEAQNALSAAQTWLVTSRKVYEGYRQEHLRLKETVARARALLCTTAACLPDELIVHIASFFVLEGRRAHPEPVIAPDVTPGTPIEENASIWDDTACRAYPLAMSQVCRRWRVAVLGSPRLWAYQMPLKSPPLANLFALRAGSCSLDVVWTNIASSDSSSVAIFGQTVDRWRSLRAKISSSLGDSYPFTSAGSHSALTTLFLSANSFGKAPAFSTSHLKLMPNLEKLELSNVQLSVPPPFRHPKPIELAIKYGGVISFRAKDMEDISIVFPNLKRFKLSIRGPYINKVSPPNTPEQAIIPYSFPSLEELDISAKDLSHSLSRFHSAYLPRLATLRLRDNGLPAAATFFQHLVRSRAPLTSLSLTDYSPNAIKAYRGSRTVEHLAIAPLTKAVDILKPSPFNPPVSPTSPSHVKDSSISFPKVTRVTIQPLAVVPDGGIGRHETSLLSHLAQVVRERNRTIMGTSSLHSNTPSDMEERARGQVDAKAAMMVGFGKAVEKQGETLSGRKSEERLREREGVLPMGDDTMASQPSVGAYLTRDLPPLPPASPPSSGPQSPHSHLRSRSHSVKSIGEQYGVGARKRRLTMNGMAAVPILEVEYTPVRPKGQAAMEEVYSALVEGRMRWKEIGMDGW